MSWLDMWDEGPHIIVNNKSKGPSEVELDKWKGKFMILAKLTRMTNVIRPNTRIN